jgi:Ca2+-binding RTX toxin-like protein
MAEVYAGPLGLDMRDLDPSILMEATPNFASSTIYRLIFQDQQITFIGTGFTYDSTGSWISGTVTANEVRVSGVIVYQAVGLSNPVTSWLQWAAAGDKYSALYYSLIGDDSIFGSDMADYMCGFLGNNTMYGFAGADNLQAFVGDDWMDGGAGNDTIVSTGGNDTMYGGEGDDYLAMYLGVNYLRGGAGNDLVNGGGGFDDINGNMGNDTLLGQDGQDWVVGGQGNDSIFGNNDFDIVYGNMGNDTVDGGAGNDWVRGGQGDDSVMGGAGDDWIWGDKGNDTISGGTGADIFHSLAGAGIDRITDFSYSQGDRLVLDGGPSRTITQVGFDVLVDMGNGDQVILVGVSLSSLGAGWIT